MTAPPGAAPVLPSGIAPRRGRGIHPLPPCRASGYVSGMDVIRLIFAIIFPPLGVLLQVGLGKHFWINILLTLLGFIPGIVHAVWVIAKVGPDRSRPAAV